MNENVFIKRQICKYMTDKKLIEFIDKLKAAPTEFYAHVHACGDKDESGHNQTSLIGIKLLDYSNGTGDKTVTVEANITPDELAFIFSAIKRGVQTFEFKQDKIFGIPNDKNQSPVTKLNIIRAEKDKTGKPRNYPWFIQIENGTGEKAQRGNGGTYMKSGSYKMTSKVFVNVSEYDMFRLLNRIGSYVSVWELTYAPKNIRLAKSILEENRRGDN